MEGRRGLRLLAAAVAVLAACGSDDKPRSGITIDTLSAASGTACPVPLEVAVDNSGIDTPSPATGTVDVGRASSVPLASDPSQSPIDAADAVLVSCSAPLADGSSLTMLLVAARTDAASEIVIPAAADAGALTENQATQLANDMSRTKDGELVPVPGDKAVAVMPTDVNGATSAALLVSAENLKRAQVEQVARQLDQRLR